MSPKSRKRPVAVRRRIIEPADVAVHFFFHGGGWWRFEMNIWIANRAGDDLHYARWHRAFLFRNHPPV
jgi:hypothetical protein